MKYIKKLKKTPYYQQLLAILLVFTLVFMTVYALFLYNSSKNQILKAIQTSNHQSLLQTKYSYDTFADTMTSLCFSLYLNSETQSMMYNQNTTYQDANEYLFYLKSSILNVYPSVYSISIYNGRQQKLYSTLDNSSEYYSELTSLIDSALDIPKLLPILRKIPHVYRDSYTYVFSYILYDFTNNTGNPHSYIILEQNASWLIENFNKISHSNDHVPSSVYLLDKNGNVCSEDVERIPDIDSRILEEHLSEHGIPLSTEDSTYYTHDLDGVKYLVTNLRLNDNGDSLLMIQNYHDVFSNLESFRFTFLIILAAWILLLTLVIIYISRKLYEPIQNTLSYVEELNGSSMISERNEFDQLRAIYKDSYDKINKLNSCTQDTLMLYHLEKLLTDSPSALQSFTTVLPEHWLSNPIDGQIRLLLLTVHQDTDDNNALSKDDFNIILFSIQNILTELLNEECQAEVFITRNSYIWGILHTDNTDYDLVLEDVIKRTKKTLKKYISLPLDVTYSRPTEHPSQLNVLYREVLATHDYHYIYGPDAIISPLTCKKNLANESCSIPKNPEKKCLSALKCDHVENAIEALHLIFDAFQEMQYKNVQICVMAITNQINFVMKEMCVSRNIISAIPFEHIYHQIDKAQYLDEIEESLIQHIRDSMNVFIEKKNDSKQQAFVEKVQEYIHLNYSNPNLSSQMLGDYLGLSAKYVMKKFQDSTEITLNDYITDIRLQQAVPLLKNNNLPISKVAEQIGILNENYFYKLFKKKYGCTPREFSTSYSKDNVTDTGSDVS